MSAANAALAVLYQAHATELNGFARRRVGRHEAEDVVQDAYLHLLQRGTASTLAQPRAYLFRTAANLAVDFARRTKVRMHHADEVFDLNANSVSPANPEAATGAAMELARLQASLTKLPPLCRAAFLLSRIEGLTHTEIAGRLGVSVRTIDRFMARAWDHLRSHFGTEFEI